MLHYKGAVPLDSTYFGVYVDSDLGSFDDDYIGSDTLLHLGFTYNGSNEDDDYGLAPPALGTTFLKTATYPDGRDNDRNGIVDEQNEQQGLTHFLYWFGGGGMHESPHTGQHYYNYLQTRWKNGQYLTLGGYGFDFSDVPINYSYPGDPITGQFWSELNLDRAGAANTPSDRYFLVSTGPFTMQPGATQEITFAIVWARGSDHLDSLTHLRTRTARLHRFTDVFLQPDTVLTPRPPAPRFVLGFAPNYPNPFRESTTIRYSLPQPMAVHLAVYDVLGREVAVLVDGQQEAGVRSVMFEASGLPPGVYVARLRLDHLRFARTMLLVR